MTRRAIEIPVCRIAVRAGRVSRAASDRTLQHACPASKTDVGAARAGAHERAAQLAEKLRLDHQKNAEFLICAARCYAQCSSAVPGKSALQRQYREMALAALQTALEQGYKDLITLETHPDLDPVRASPAFQQLLEKVSAPPSPESAPAANR